MAGTTRVIAVAVGIIFIVSAITVVLLQSAKVISWSWLAG